jgi:hypothetical protein
VMTTMFCKWGKRAGVALAIAMLLLALPGAALAQDDPNPGAVTFTGGFDVPTLYFFRGIRQEVDPKVTLWPYGDLGLSLFSGDGGVKSVGVNIGVWNSLQTGSSGFDGPSDRLHYEEDFYATLGLGFGGGVTLGTTFTAYTSPNAMFNTVKEISFKVSAAQMIAPYGLLAFELDDSGQADVGSKKGTYLELGVGPVFPLMADGPTLTIPVKLGLSLSDYYENPATGEDSTFGFFDIGGLLTLPLRGIPSRFGSWNIHGGADLLVFGDTTELFNVDTDGEVKKNKVVGLFGIGVTY